MFDRAGRPGCVGARGRLCDRGPNPTSEPARSPGGRPSCERVAGSVPRGGGQGAHVTTLPRAGWRLDAAVFVSGAALMGLEIVGSRVLAPVFGTSLFVWGALITTFLAALALGYALGGRLADRRPDPGTLATLLAGSGIVLFVVFASPEALLAALGRVPHRCRGLRPSRAARGGFSPRPRGRDARGRHASSVRVRSARHGFRRVRAGGGMGRRALSRVGSRRAARALGMARATARSRDSAQRRGGPSRPGSAGRDRAPGRASRHGGGKSRRERRCRERGARPGGRPGDPRGGSGSPVAALRPLHGRGREAPRLTGLCEGACGRARRARPRRSCTTSGPRRRRGST